MRTSLLRGACLLAAATWAVPALAHIELLEPARRYDDQKSGPCGRATDARSPNVTVIEPGATIEVVFYEEVAHPGYFRIAFDEDGTDNLGDPLEPSGGQTYNPADVLVLADGITDQGQDPYVVEVTLPAVECDNCTLQLVQVMMDKPPWGDGNDLYYQCADLVLQVGAGTPTDTDPPTTDTDTPPTNGTTDTEPTEDTDGTAPAGEDTATGDTSGAGCGCDTSGGASWLALVGAAALIRRRRR